jgi:catechol 2,3-dioxygenase-like lactoylglutathione lyase family enzyme
MVTGIHHFSLIASSRKTVSFYEKLGFLAKREIVRVYDTVVLMECNGVGLEVFIDPRHPRREANEPLGLRCISLSVDDIDKAAKQWQIPSDQIKMDWSGDRYFNIADPDGNTVQLHADKCNE